MKKQVILIFMLMTLSLTGCAAIKQYAKDMHEIAEEGQEEKAQPQDNSYNLAYNTYNAVYEVAITTGIIITNPSQIEVYFSPYDDCEKQWIETITKASSYVYVSCFGITNENITKALCDKSKSGIKVIVCTDKMQSGNKTAKIREQELKAAGAEYIIKKKQVLEHNKMVVTDDKYAIIGSWNLSGNAQPQDNSIVVFNNTEIAIKIRAAIERIYKRDK